MLRLFRHHLNVFSISVALVEAALIYGLSKSLYVTIGYYKHFPIQDGILTFPTLLATVVELSMVSVGMYSQRHFFNSGEMVGRTIVSLPLAALGSVIIIIMIEYLFASGHSYWMYLWCAASIAAFFPAVLIIRKICLNGLDRVDWMKTRLVVLGTGERVAKINELSRELHHRSFTVLGYLQFKTSDSSDDVENRTDSNGVQHQNFVVDPKDIVSFCQDNNIDEIVVAMKERRGMPVKDLLECKLNGISIADFATFWERNCGQVELEDLSPSWLLFSDGFEMGPIRSLIKRVFDITVAITILVLTAPICIITAILTKLESDGQIFYLQERVGQQGKSFMIIKFRSMRVDAEASGPRWASKNDSRVTRVGSFIRKVRIDEIPQVINVLKGDMSLVGPRPERPVFVKVLAEKIPYYNARHAAKPGITGWAQINYPYGATEEDARKKLSYDLYYIKNGSSFLDAVTLLQTVKVLLWNDGAH